MMILVKISGYEPYYIQEFSKKWHEDLVRIFKCDEKELNFVAYDSFFIHEGHEQTSFFIDVEFSIAKEQEKYMNEAFEYMKKALKDLAVHARISYTIYQKEVLSIDDRYPQYLTKTNTVAPIEIEEEITEEERELSDDEIMDMINQTKSLIDKKKEKHLSTDPFNNYRNKAVTEFCEDDECDEDCDCHEHHHHHHHHHPHEDCDCDCKHHK